MTPEEFITKNSKWIIILLFALFNFKSVQSCNRKTTINMGAKVYLEEIDSLKKEHSTYYKISQDSIAKLNFELKLANEHARSSEERARAVQSAVEKLRSNTTTTVVVRGAEEVKDTLKKK